MKIRIYGFAVIIGTFLFGCAKFNLDQVKYEVKPNPLELHGDSVKWTVNASYPEKLVPKKADIVITPVLKFQGGEKVFDPIRYQGEKSTGNGQVLSHAGGKIKPVNLSVAYAEGMQNAELHLRVSASVKGKEKYNESTPTPIALGTIVTPLLVQNDERFSAAPHGYGPIYKTAKVSFYFPYNSASLRPGEKNSEEMKSLKAFVAAQQKDGAVFERFEINGWASPDGESFINNELSQDRSTAAKNFLEGTFKSAFRGSSVSFVVNGKGADTDGFNTLLNTSPVDNKGAVKSKISSNAMNSDFKALGSSVYQTLEQQVFTPLRRAEATLTVKQRQKTEEEIRTMALENGDLALPEFLFAAATLLSDPTQQLQALEFAAQKFPSDYQPYNNRGVVFANQGKWAEAKTEFKKAEKIAPSASEVANNLGAIALKEGNRDEAKKYLAKSNTSEAKYNMGILQVKSGDYSAASASFGSNCTFNAALAKVLSGAPTQAASTLDCGADKDKAIASYLKAIAAARVAGDQGVYEHLRKAIGRDATLKAKAKKDLEFLNYREKPDFKDIVN
jgi:tetratricopeptide (TPR) repeat protein/outer membrane protein OmpA-like peptidoglycan-associated protein